MADTANLILPLMAAAQSQKHVTHNEAVLRLDVLVQLAVKSTTLTAPPGSPADGDRYLIASGPTGAWAGKDLNITYYSSGAWVFLPPRKGWLCWDEVNDILLVWTGAAWSDYAQAGGFVTNTTLGAGNLTAKIKDANFTLTDDAVTSKAMRFELSAITAANTRILNVQDLNGTIALTDQTQTWSGSITFSNATLTFGSSTAAGTISIGTGATVAAATKTINVGTSGVATSVTNITFGSAVAGALGTTTFNTPTVTFGSNVTAIGAAAANLSALYVGIGGATANATNRLSINTPAVLFNNAGADINATVNKAATGNDASFTFQTAFSTRALFGLLADDNFTIKVSPNGSSFFTGVNIRNADGHVGVAGASADADNGLSVIGNLLLNRYSTSIYATLNKQSAANDASFTFQTNFSTRAIFGTLASDNFTLKVSSNGSSFFNAFVVNSGTGYTTFDNGLAVGINKGVYSPYSVSNDLYPLQSSLPLGISHANVAPTEAPAYGGLLTVNHSANRCFQWFVDGQTGSFMVRANHVNNPDIQNDWTSWYKIWSQLDQGSGSGLTADKVTSYTVATLPSASSRGAGAVVFVSNESGGAVLAFSDGTSWRRVTDRATVS